MPKGFESPGFHVSESAGNHFPQSPRSSTSGNEMVQGTLDGFGISVEDHKDEKPLSLELTEEQRVYLETVLLKDIRSNKKNTVDYLRSAHARIDPRRFVVPVSLNVIKRCASSRGILGIGDYEETAIEAYLKSKYPLLEGMLDPAAPYPGGEGGLPVYNIGIETEETGGISGADPKKKQPSSPRRTTDRTDWMADWERRRGER